jgi:hypothetical protein
MRRAINWQELSSVNWHPALDHPIDIIIVGIIIHQGVCAGVVDIHQKHFQQIGGIIARIPKTGERL